MAKKVGLWFWKATCASGWLSRYRELTLKAATIGFVNTCPTFHTYGMVSGLGSSQMNAISKNKI